MIVSFITEYLRGALAFTTTNPNKSASQECASYKAAAQAAEAARAERAAEERAQLRVRGRRALEAALEVLRRGGPWALEASDGPHAAVESCRSPGSAGKVYRLTATFPGCAPARVWSLLRADCGGAGWLLADARSLQTLEQDGVSASDVQLQRSAPRLGGLVAGREFLLVRRWSALPGNAFALASASAEHSAAPRAVALAPRAECGPGGWLVEPAPGGGGTRVRWLVDCALGGWLPPRLVDVAAARYMLAYVAHLRARCQQPATPV